MYEKRTPISSERVWNGCVILPLIALLITHPCHPIPEEFGNSIISVPITFDVNVAMHQALLQWKKGYIEKCR